MLKCSYCETPLIAGASFCYICGTPVILNPDENVSSLVLEKEANPISANLTADISVDNTPSSVQENYVSTYENLHLSPFLDASERIPVPSVIHPLSQVSKRTNKENLLLLTIVVLVIITGVGSIYYGAIYQPALNAANLRAAQATATAKAIAQANNLHTMYIKTTSRKPFLVDPLNNPPTSLWSTYQLQIAQNDACFFKNETFNVTIDKKNYVNWCNDSFSIKNFALQVQMQIIQGDAGGIMFRYISDPSGDQNKDQGLYLTIYSNGEYGLYRYGRSTLTTIDEGHASTIKTSHAQSNLVSIIALNKQLYFYINKQFVAQFQDTTNAHGDFNSGTFALAAEDDTQPTEVAFSNVEVWSVD
jgi:hypothetical protein